MKIFLAGDYYSGTGPANVTGYYIENLPKGTLYQKMRSKAARVPEILINTIRADVVVYSGYSRQNIIGMKLAAKMGKPIAYIMHGCVEYENKINREPDEEMSKTEREFIALSDVVFAVSGQFKEWLAENYPEYADKFDSIANGIDDNVIDILHKQGDCEKDEHMIFSVGGGMPRKKIVNICRAVEILRSTYDNNLRLTVVGAKGADTDAINAYSFVDNRGIVPFEQVVSLMRKSAVFVQNSCFETFGLAPVEAIAAGSAVLCSKEIGALEIIHGVTDSDIIYDYNNPDEIAEKVKELLIKSNNQRLKDGIDWEKESWKKRAEELVKKLEKML